MSAWIAIDGVDELPDGNWLVEIEKERYASTFHTARKEKNYIFIAGNFAFDLPTVIAYHPIPPR